MCQFHTPVIEDFDSTIIFPSHRVLLPPRGLALLPSSTFRAWWHASPGGFASAQKEGIFKKKVLL